MKKVQFCDLLLFIGHSHFPIFRQFSYVPCLKIEAQTTTMTILGSMFAVFLQNESLKHKMTTLRDMILLK